MQNEILELKMENQTLKYAENVRKLETAIDTLKKENNATLERLVEVKNVEIDNLKTQLSEKNKELRGATNAFTNQLAAKNIEISDLSKKSEELINTTNANANSLTDQLTAKNTEIDELKSQLTRKRSHQTHRN